MSKTKKELWVQFSDKENFLRNEHILYGYLADSEGDDEVVIYCQKERAIKRLPRNRNISDRPGSIEQIDESLRGKASKSRRKIY